MRLRVMPAATALAQLNLVRTRNPEDGSREERRSPLHAKFRGELDPFQ